ncbi:MAG: hypothetical protein MUE36_15765 [Acidimicrobiales bacterium]|jgi:hypothetical protein|nr:hypothetical protein [Acidimicrobiales bacterium]
MSEARGDEMVTDATREAEAQEATAHGRADRPPTEEEERLAEQAAEDVDPAVGEHFDEMNKVGAEVRGEGEIGG